MGRNQSYKAVILSVQNRGELRREVSFLTDTQGLMRATLWGGAKSKLRAWLSPWHLGTLYIYHDPVRNSYKVSDFDIVNQFLPLRENLDRTWAANAISEVVMASSPAASSSLASQSDYMEALALVIDSLEGLEQANSLACRPLFLRWLWLWLDLTGHRVVLDSCSSCACDGSVNEVLWYRHDNGSLLCNTCRQIELAKRNQIFQNDTALSLPFRTWLCTSLSRPAYEQTRLGLDRGLLSEAGQIIVGTAVHELGRELRVWNTWPQ